MNHRLKALSTALCVAATTLGCASQPAAPPAASSATAAAPSCDRAQDQQAILKMAGSYDVVFDFAETDVLTAGYKPHSAHKSYATELVLVVEDRPGKVALQHILQMGTGKDATIIKHWRQDWSYEDRDVLEFQGKEIWQKRTLPPEAVKCTWTQAVYEIGRASCRERV